MTMKGINILERVGGSPKRKLWVRRKLSCKKHMDKKALSFNTHFNSSTAQTFAFVWIIPAKVKTLKTNLTEHLKTVWGEYHQLRFRVYPMQERFLHSPIH